MAGRERARLRLLYIRLHDKVRELPWEIDTTVLHVFWEDRAGSRADEDCEQKRAVRGITEECHDVFLVPTDVCSQYVITISYNRTVSADPRVFPPSNNPLKCQSYTTKNQHILFFLFFSFMSIIMSKIDKITCIESRLLEEKKRKKKRKNFVTWVKFSCGCFL